MSVFCDTCGDRIDEIFGYMHKQHCRGYSHSQVNAMTDTDRSVLIGLVYMAWAIQASHRSELSEGEAG